MGNIYEKYIVVVKNWNSCRRTESGAAVLCVPTASVAPLLPVCRPSVLLPLLCLHTVFWCVCCVCYLSLFSCFMVSPRKKYSFRSVILTQYKCHATFCSLVPLLPSFRKLFHCQTAEDLANGNIGWAADVSKMPKRLRAEQKLVSFCLFFAGLSLHLGVRQDCYIFLISVNRPSKV